MPTPTAEFDYVLPSAAVAQTPVEPRDSSRLLDTRDMSDHRFCDVGELLREGDLVVVNRTRVRAARLRGEKVPTGGQVELLLLRRLDEEVWEAMLKPARRLRPGAEVRVGDIICEVVSEQTEGVAQVRLKAPGDIEEAIDELGEIPLPPYITHRPSDPLRYQTIFAQRPGSAAAPTAGLHFTSGVVSSLQEAGIRLTEIDLEVGLATFRPIAASFIEDHGMHAEVVEIGERAAEEIAACRRRGGRVVAIGTTVVRALESRARSGGLVSAGWGETDLYLRPGSRFEVVDAMVTNFHLPRSSLIVLVAAFMGSRWRDVYATAMDRGYRFLSFGDAMYCERAE